MSDYAALEKRLGDREVILLDGAIGTQLQAMDVPMADFAWFAQASTQREARDAFIGLPPISTRVRNSSALASDFMIACRSSRKTLVDGDEPLKCLVGCSTPRLVLSGSIAAEPLSSAGGPTRPPPAHD